jgi:hypothetical protein
MVEEITQRLREGLEERLSTFADRGRSLDEIGPAEELARRMLEVVPIPSRWDDLLGPFYSTRQVARLLGGVSRQAVADRKDRGTLLGLKTADGEVVYPTFQFGDGAQVIPGLAEVIQCFSRRTGTDDWTMAGWLVSPLRPLKGKSAIGWLRSGNDPEPLLALARDAARRFSQ